ncbi:MAG: hypothetical protein WA978_14380 [Sphingopyxis granuli]|uniref:hypothetical protein n=1 Tax=Sphingopyxis granuli TaxID=267128 RepID=UPI003C7153A8
MSSDLKDALVAVDWNQNVSEFTNAPVRLDKLTACCRRISLFTHELSFQDFDNPAIPFLQEMKASAFQVPACLALGLTKPAAGLMRAAVESALYYSYFRSHPQELRTLVSKSNYYLSRRQIIEYHKMHTPRFGVTDKSLGLIDKLETWYGEISAIVHGQIPGVWTSKSLSSTSSLKGEVKAPIKIFERASEIIQLVFLMTVDLEDWEAVNPISRSELLKGLSSSQLQELGLPKV